MIPMSSLLVFSNMARALHFCKYFEALGRLSEHLFVWLEQNFNGIDLC